jgi:hypothetical protein
VKRDALAGKRWSWVSCALKKIGSYRRPSNAVQKTVTSLVVKSHRSSRSRWDY